MMLDFVMKHFLRNWVYKISVARLLIEKCDQLLTFSIFSPYQIHRDYSILSLAKI